MAGSRGLWLAVDGIDGAGKTTAAAMACAALRQGGEAAYLAPEFSDGPIGAALTAVIAAQRFLALDGTGWTRRADTLALLSDFVFQVERDIQPRLRRGETVISDRGLLSLVGYQAARLEIRSVENGVDWVARLAALAFRGLPLPDIHVLLDLDIGAAEARLRGRGEDLDGASRAFLVRARECIDGLVAAGTYPCRSLAVEGATEEAVRDAILSVLADLRLGK